MIYIKKVRKIGNSLAIPLPTEMAKYLKVKAGDELYISDSSIGKDAYLLVSRK
jgi:antitoxin component of MazEF toxin-antitoxin module